MTPWGRTPTCANSDGMADSALLRSQEAANICSGFESDKLGHSESSKLGKSLLLFPHCSHYFWNLSGFLFAVRFFLRYLLYDSIDVKPRKAAFIQRTTTSVL